MNRQFRNEQGAALIVGLVLLVVVTIFAIAAMNTASTTLALARNDQNFENAFQAAESGLETAISQGNFSTTAEVNFSQAINAHDQVSVRIVYEESSIVPDKAFSLGAGSGVAAYHFLATAVAESRRDPDASTTRDSPATHTQAFYVVGPDSPTL